MGRLGNEAGNPVGIAARPMVGPHHQQAGVLALGSRGANGCSRLNSRQLTGIISVVAFSFRVQEPSGIIAEVSERSRDSSRLM